MTSVGMAANWHSPVFPQLDFACGLGVIGALEGDVVREGRSLMPVDGYLPVCRRCHPGRTRRQWIGLRSSIRLGSLTGANSLRGSAALTALVTARFNSEAPGNPSRTSSNPVAALHLRRFSQPEELCP